MVNGSYVAKKVERPPIPPSSNGKKDSTGQKSVSIKLKNVEQLIPYFVDKSEDKIELRFSADFVIALIENLGGIVSETMGGEYGEKIKDLLRMI